MAVKKEISFLSIIANFVLAIAWINFINLSTAKSFERGKEVGLRKVVGARRAQLIGQFLFESVLINFFALLLAALIVILAHSIIQQFYWKESQQRIFYKWNGDQTIVLDNSILIVLCGGIDCGHLPGFSAVCF